MRIGLLHPGEMGAAIGTALRASGHTVLWVSSGRSMATAQRAERAGLEDATTIVELARRAEVILSICPPRAAVGVARPLAHFRGLYVDANAVSPMTARAIAGLVERYVDGGIIGPPPSGHGTTRLYLSGAEAATVAQLFAATGVDARLVSEEIGAASAVKMAYAAWTKGSAALLLAIRVLARQEGVEATLVREWERSQPQLLDRSAAAARAALGKGWRWAGEMDEIADTFATDELPDGFSELPPSSFAAPPEGWRTPTMPLRRSSAHCGLDRRGRAAEASAICAIDSPPPRGSRCRRARCAPYTSTVK